MNSDGKELEQQAGEARRPAPGGDFLERQQQLATVNCQSDLYTAPAGNVLSGGKATLAPGEALVAASKLTPRRECFA